MTPLGALTICLLPLAVFLALWKIATLFQRSPGVPACPSCEETWSVSWLVADSGDAAWMCERCRVVWDVDVMPEFSEE